MAWTPLLLFHTLVVRLHHLNLGFLPKEGEMETISLLRLDVRHETETHQSL